LKTGRLARRFNFSFDSADVATVVQSYHIDKHADSGDFNVSNQNCRIQEWLPLLAGYQARLFASRYGTRQHLCHYYRNIRPRSAKRDLNPPWKVDGRPPK